MTTELRQPVIVNHVLEKAGNNHWQVPVDKLVICFEREAAWAGGIRLHIGLHVQRPRGGQMHRPSLDRAFLDVVNAMLLARVIANPAQVLEANLRRHHFGLTTISEPSITIFVEET